MIRPSKSVSPFIGSVLAWACAGSIAAGVGGCAHEGLTARAVATAQTDEEPLYHCPAWARETFPEWTKPFMGRFGLPEPYPHQKALIGDVTAGIDLWQANHFIAYRKETAKYLYESYTPTEVRYKPGTLPSYEKIVAQYTAGLTNPRDKAVALLTHAMLDKVQHPSIPPMCVDPGKDRGVDDEALLASGRAWCNEQARVFARLCQVAGIPARMIFLFRTPVGGHVITEFYADGHWCMADNSWFCVFPDANGRLMSAAECHGSGKAQAGLAYYKRYQEIATYDDERMVGDKFLPKSDTEQRRREVAASAARTRAEYKAHTAKDLGEGLEVFGVLNYPLPM